jgi:hypothetical protein
MKQLFVRVAQAASVLLLLAACAQQPVEQSTPDLIGAWRSQVQFTSGGFAPVKDLEFMYSFNQGGTMTESSNYDATPPVPPAYGVWRRTGAAEFEARYEFFATRAPDEDEIVAGGGWLPAGRGVLTERITLSPDGKTFTSQIRFETLDGAGQPVEGGDGDATGRGVRIAF